MNTLFKCVVVSVFVLKMNSGLAADSLDKLDLAPELPKTLSDGGLKKLENEPGYEAPKSVLRRSPKYPPRQARKAQGGMVEISYMVNKDGGVFNPIIINSTHPDFEAPALEAVKKYQYEPAKLDSKHVASSTSIRIIFEIKHSKDAVDRRFYKLYRKTQKRLMSKQPDQKMIRLDLDKMADSDYLSARILVTSAPIYLRSSAEFIINL